MEAVPWLSESEQRAWRTLQYMQMRLDGVLARQLAADSCLSYPDFRVLEVLTSVPEGRLRPFELAEILGWEKSRLSHHIARMRQRGLVGKELWEQDRRGTVVVATDKGREEMVAAAPGHVRAVRRLFIDVLDPTELETIAAAAETVLAAIEADEAEGR